MGPYYRKVDDHRLFLDEKTNMGSTVGVMNAVEISDSNQLKEMGENLSKGCDIFLRNEDAREYFIDFLKKEDWKKNLGTIACARILSDKQHWITEIPSSAYSDFSFPAKPSLTISKVENFTKWEKETVEGIYDTKWKLRTILLATVFPLFLKSTQYKAFLELKSFESDVMVELPREDIHDGTTREERLNNLFLTTPLSNTKDVIASATETVDCIEMKNLLSAGQWIRNIFAAVEDLRLCVSIATASNERRGFPLIYVNKAFEQTTGYSRSQIVGQNCKFLQSDKTEQDQILQLSNALAEAQPVKVAITNRRKDGSGKLFFSPSYYLFANKAQYYCTTDFLNLLSMKPVFDQNGVYSYVIGVQCDYSREDLYVQDIKLVDDLLAILPNMML